MSNRKKFYPVALSNGQTGIFTDWDEAKAFIATCPSNAKYKKLDDLPSAQDFLDTLPTGTGRPAHTVEPAAVPSGTCVAYVDGSYNPDKAVWGYGVYLADPNDPGFEPVELSGSGDKYAESRNVTGEVYAAMNAVKKARELGFKAIEIHHDYEGIQAWVTGRWTANMELTQVYKAWMAKQASKIDIAFVHVKGHSGDELNDRVDALAKQGCGVA